MCGSNSLPQTKPDSSEQKNEWMRKIKGYKVNMENDAHKSIDKTNISVFTMNLICPNVQLLNRAQLFNLNHLVVSEKSSSSLCVSLKRYRSFWSDVIWQLQTKFCPLLLLNSQVWSSITKFMFSCYFIPKQVKCLFLTKKLTSFSCSKEVLNYNPCIIIIIIINTIGTSSSSSVASG